MNVDSNNWHNLLMRTSASISIMGELFQIY